MQYNIQLSSLYQCSVFGVNIPDLGQFCFILFSRSYLVSKLDSQYPVCSPCHDVVSTGSPVTDGLLHAISSVHKI